jgi:hypothetical protein
MAQVTLGKFFSGFPIFDGEGANHVTEDELLNFSFGYIIKILIFIIAVSYDKFKSTNLKFNYCFNSNIKTR